MAIRWDKLTVKAQEAVQRANDLATEHGNPELLPVHLLAALLEDQEGIVAPLLERIGMHAATVLREAMREIEQPAKSFGRRRAQAASLRCRNAAAGERLQRSRQLQGRIRLHRAPAAGDDASSRATPRRRSCARAARPTTRS